MLNNPIICAIDTNDIEHALYLTEQVKDYVGMIKLGLEFFVSHGKDGIKRITDKYDIPIFLDLKFHDIPNTVGKSILALKGLSNIHMITVHLSGEVEMMKYAYEASEDIEVHLVGVTRLTSLSPNKKEFDRLLDIASQVNLYGIVSSVYEISVIRTRLGNDIKIITPGIRFDSDSDDHSRAGTPKNAIEQGASYIVVGRPITMSEFPKKSAKDICQRYL